LKHDFYEVSFEVVSSFDVTVLKAAQQAYKFFSVSWFLCQQD